MYSHNMVGTNDLAASKTFYDAIFTAVGGKEGMFDEARGRVAYAHKDGLFVAVKPINGEPASVANGNTIGFTMDTPEQCHAWHDAGVAAGGSTCEDPPGLREMGGRKLYLAYLRDPTGHKLCALCRIV
jgi:catechol 2,3-dioxygenase-like lactoylglutathione lyase family enzyme